ncbi:hypothetical protein HDV03_003779 [Kappamyces sp. JEL0829]|nr:hypothetical protein HDV03_003779 [Kappamyces sp. JEL0829]
MPAAGKASLQQPAGYVASTQPLTETQIPKSQWGKYALAWSILQFVISLVIEIYIAVTLRSLLATIDSNWGSNSKITIGGTDYDKNKVLSDGQILTVYHGLFIAAQLFQIFLISDALMQLSLIQLVTTTAFNFASWGDALVQLVQAKSILSPELAAYLKIPNAHPSLAGEIAQVVVFLFFCIGWIYLTYKLYFVFGWTTYKEMGADVQFRSKRRL